MVCMTQLSDVLEYVFRKCFGRHKNARNISPNKTVEGFIGGILGGVLIGTGLWWITPFSWWQAALMAFTIALMGFFWRPGNVRDQARSWRQGLWHNDSRAWRDPPILYFFLLRPTRCLSPYTFLLCLLK